MRAAILAASPHKTQPWLFKVTPSSIEWYLDTARTLAPSIPIYAKNTSAVPDRYDQQNCLRAGRIWQRSHLLATARGLAGRPCNEAIEMIDHERAQGKPPKRATLLAESFGDNAWQPMFLFYMGYPTLTARPSPRRPIETVVT
jgi:nitroreductase